MREALRAVHREAYKFSKPNELPGGRQMQVAIARALVVPLTNFDENA